MSTSSRMPQTLGHSIRSLVMHDMRFSRQISAIVRQWMQFLPAISRQRLSIWPQRSHVDRSITGADAFLETNIVGTYRLLEAAKSYHATLGPDVRSRFRFVHVSTDEVYGSLGATGRFREDTPYEPSSPYSASKAASDHLAHAWYKTYGLPVIVSNCSNNYGPYQFPEKLIPLTILNALDGKSLSVYGTGSNVRDWLHVDDHARGLIMLLERGEPGEKYNFGGDSERTNLSVVELICDILDRLSPVKRPRRSLISFVPDRPGHDLRYAIDASKARQHLGWSPQNHSRAVSNAPSGGTSKIQLGGSRFVSRSMVANASA